ncbi:hypothetical protein ACFX1Q_003163 [Malus domestica]
MPLNDPAVTKTAITSSDSDYDSKLSTDPNTPPLRDPFLWRSCAEGSYQGFLATMELKSLHDLIWGR